MADDKQQPKRPSHIAYQVSDGQDGKSYFNKVGAAFEHKDRQGYNVVLDAMPVDGRVSLRTPKERLEEMRSDPEQQQAQDQRQNRQAGQQQPSQSEAKPQPTPEHER